MYQNIKNFRNNNTKWKTQQQRGEMQHHLLSISKLFALLVNINIYIKNKKQLKQAIKACF